MGLIVQKYGGSSVGDVERIRHVARRVAERYQSGSQVVVVVSAMRGVTDNLLGLAGALNASPDERELDMLLATGEQTTIALTAMALHDLGVPAISMTGAQAGIITNGIHTKAKIHSITPQSIQSELEKGSVVIVAGFQGQSLHGQHITTLGRGGSDLTAIALAAALKADLCQIFTDVDGVFTTDPRVCDRARKIEEISYDEMLELAGAGAKVMQARSVEFAKKYGVVFEVRSSLNNNPGTIVKEESESMEGVVVRGVTADKKQAKVTLVGVPDRPGRAARIFRALGEAAVNVDMIVQNVSHGASEPMTDISFTVDDTDLVKASHVFDASQESIGFRGVETEENIAKIAIVGVGMRSHAGIAAKLFQTLADLEVNIKMISTSEIRVAVVVDRERADDSVDALHRAFIA